MFTTQDPARSCLGSLETGRLGHAKSNLKGSKLMYVTPLASIFCPGMEKKA